ncbi:MAG: hypothetical protein AAF518_20040 [Spirochaetota bacterium]
MGKSSSSNGKFAFPLANIARREKSIAMDTETSYFSTRWLLFSGIALFALAILRIWTRKVIRESEQEIERKGESEIAKKA